LLWQFFWHEFCDWYLEIKKLGSARTRGDRTGRNLLTVFEILATGCSTGDAFLTEELWSAARERRLGGGRSRSRWLVSAVRHNQVTDHPAERQMQLLQEMVTAARNQRPIWA